MLPLEHSAILLSFIKLPFGLRSFVLSFLSGCLRHVLLFDSCFVEFVDLLLDEYFFIKQLKVPTALESYEPYFEIMGQ